MNIVVAYNPVSGMGRSRAASAHLQQRLEAAGHTARRLRTALEPPETWLDPALEAADVIVVVGGDGAVRQTARSAARHGTALYQFPGGTENLFAREFHMDRMIARLITGLDRFRTVEADLAEANGDPLVLMASIGVDAEVVHDLAAQRGASITHASYLMPMLRQFARWSPPRLTVTVDDRRVVDGRCGMVVVANSRQYAWRFDPAWKASMTDGALDVVFLPISGTASLLGSLAVHVAGQQKRLRRSVYARGRTVRIECDEPAHFQVDGDPPAPVYGNGAVDQRVSELLVQLRPARLRVLLPG